MTTTTPPRFEAPGPGTWERDCSHATPSPTRVFRRLTTTTMPSAYREVFADFGGPIDTMDVRFVHGAMYRRIVPLIGGASDRPPPPRPIMWAALRLHPTFRRRERAARRTWSERPDRVVVADWYLTERQRWIDETRPLEEADPATMSDDELAVHLERVDARLVSGWRRHHVLHGSDIGPIGDLLVHGRQWGLEVDQLLSLLRGSSPASAAAAEHARGIAAALRAADVDPAVIHDLDQVRTVPDAARLLDRYLSETRWHVVTSYDIEGLTVGEMPAATCALIRAHADDDVEPRGGAGAESSDSPVMAQLEATLRGSVPAADRSRFDELLGHARAAYGMRDDNGPILAEWPTGLLRRAFLEAGRRLAARNVIERHEHVFELDTHEVSSALRGGLALTAGDVADRALDREAEAQLDPPDLLGPPLPDPDLSVFPTNIRRTMDVVLTAVSLLEADRTEQRASLDGLGIGDRTHHGTARIAATPEHLDELFATFEPGDVLVAPWTTPTFNALFAVAGAVVVREGGPLCHAAVMARELGIPTVIGCSGALELICDGDSVEVDPIAGLVRVVASPSPASPRSSIEA